MERSEMELYFLRRLVTVPAGVTVGTMFQVNTPTGPMQVIAPVGAGQQMIVNVPAAPAPVVTATATQQMTRTVAETAAGGSQPLWSAQELNGCWINCYPNDYACSIARMTNEGDDVRIGTGVCCVLLIPCPCPCGERWLREEGTNNFYKSDHVDKFTSKTSIENGAACSRKIC
ncbi:hypothetical protein EMIHUDRAFT_233078 [Emiliania huxleyi CCMP1516]|uniref:Uncharacterized protein n=2 Tax=Emiliania huxleyi TaxID=2903 RepID=A0A0D3JKL3_EMIH1|nr:hypothetical protein EMIHUDRAFT_207120 [Emiliania huxleyi CCMP1516]XP_005782691.1 hypothetical protein EMIHUDRAFT_233078 [Emiliania huxleyi CCMP1516]EOD24048.1 hypothetical protein EMIHUDRAFT_207120 [Emiliania huxleyi CCMP1516]EOD30262.1 hypothetical protein EMIHUDRAFT_233078 [Emiliania huxleyi CCMP1516]|eukprot:XP_005776477.1 hypothetical protein EMIHUDRAFT_207120 [Emiliania huxleyi CCMP1516]